jgi:hypothetical protein
MSKKPDHGSQWTSEEVRALGSTRPPIVTHADAAPSMAERARKLHQHVKNQSQHGGPVSPHMVREIGAIADHLSGDVGATGDK